MGWRKVTRVCTDLESGTVLVSVCLFVSLLEGNTVKEVIR
jgi:hypothetical protein